MATPIRRNIAHLTQTEREHFVDVIRQADLLAYSDGVSYWDKQDQIHQVTHNHDGNSFIPWHRELCNRFEKLLQQVDPDIALHYWDWTQDPRAADDGAGGTANLMTSTTFGTSNGLVDGPLAALHNGDVLAGSREQTGDPVDPPQAIKRFLGPGAPGVASDNAIITSADGLAQADQWSHVRQQIESAHDTAHVYFGPGSDIRQGHQAFEDPFVFLLHSNVDRLFAMWQAQAGQEWRLNSNLVYGSQSNTSDSEGILHNLQPWDGTVEFGAPITPWTGGSPEIEVKNCRHPSVVQPPCYDTLPMTVTQAAPTLGQPIRFLDVPEGQQTARALRLQVRSCAQVTANASVTSGFSLLSASVPSPPPDGYETKDVLVWVLFNAGNADDTASGTLMVDIAETGDAFAVPIEANVIAKPTVGSSLVLDSSGSMDLPSGVANKTRMQVLRDAAPLFVHLLDNDDGIGIVAFDTDADEREPVQTAGSLIGGAGRTDALAAIGNHATNPAGLTAIGDGIERAATQLAAVAGVYDESATVVFTDGHETAEKTVSQVASSIGSRVYAVGLGTPDQLNPGALSAIANATGGYVLLTGNPGPDDTILLQKYFAQVLAGVTSNVIVVDPDGFVQVGDEATVPYEVTFADTRSDVVVLSPAADAIEVVLEAPDGTVFTPGNGAVEVVEETYRLLRAALPGPVNPRAVAGTWHARLRVDRRRLQRWLNWLEEFGHTDQLVSVKAHGVPFTLSVQADSSLRLRVETAQPSRRPGSVATLTAMLTHGGIPLAHSVALTADVTRPDGSTDIVGLDASEPGIYTTAIPTSTAGVHRVLVRARGVDLRGTAFTREELRTLSVWDRGDDPPPVIATTDGGSTVDWCGLLRCWLSDDRVREFLARQEVDAEGLLGCLKRACR